MTEAFSVTLSEAKGLGWGINRRSGSSDPDDDLREGLKTLAYIRLTGSQPPLTLRRAQGEGALLRLPPQGLQQALERLVVARLVAELGVVAVAQEGPEVAAAPHPWNSVSARRSQQRDVEEAFRLPIRLP